MLLDNNTKKVINLINNFDNLNNIDKLKLSIYILENKKFNVNFNTRDIIILLKKVLSNLDSNYRKTIIHFSKYKYLLFFSAKYLELNDLEKKNCGNVIFMKLILMMKYKLLPIYDYSYCILNS